MPDEPVFTNFVWLLTLTLMIAFCCNFDLTFFYQEYLGIFARPNVWGLRAQAMCPCESRARLFAFPVVRLCLGRNSRISRTSHSHSFSPFSFAAGHTSTIIHQPSEKELYDHNYTHLDSAFGCHGIMHTGSRYY